MINHVAADHSQHRANNEKNVARLGWGQFAIWTILLVVGVVWGYFAYVNVAQKPSVPARLWQDQSGKYTVEATFEGVKDGKAQLLKSNGKLVEVPLERLSDDDKRHIESLKQKRK